MSITVIVIYDIPLQTNPADDPFKAAKKIGIFHQVHANPECKLNFVDLFNRLKEKREKYEHLYNKKRQKEEKYSAESHQWRKNLREM
jgi:hypothetical protein